jgi:O-methyltransferase/methyltransferase family protein
MNTIQPDARAAMMEHLQAFRLSRAIQVAAALGIADLLRKGPRTSDDLAGATDTHAPSLYRLLRALASEGIFEELPDRRFTLTPKAELLCADTPGSLQAWAEFNGSDSMWQGWGNLLYSVRTGKSGVEHAVGMNIWEFREKNPREGMLFDRSMTSLTSALSSAIVAAYDWGRFGVIADIAGGQGAQLAAILAGHPNTRGVLFDQPHVVAGAADVLGKAGVSGRCDVVGGSFFESAPAADAYVVKHILHDWSDEDSGRILETIRRAAPENARLMVIEQIIRGPNEGASGKSMDLQMLVGPGGVERTHEEFDALFTAGGWRLLETHPAGTHHIIEGVRA